MSGQSHYDGGQILERTTKKREFGDAEIKALHVANVIGICGRTCVGKSTLARQLVLHDPRYQIMQLGYEVALDLSLALHVPVKVVWEHRDRYALLLQELGEAMLWLHGEAYYAYRVLRAAQSAKVDHLIVDDVRYPVEVVTLQRGAGRAHMVRLLATDRVIRTRYYDLHGEPHPAHLLAATRETALLPHVMLMRDEWVEFEHTMNTDSSVSADIALWVENMMAAQGFDFRHPRYSEVMQGDVLPVGPPETVYGHKKGA